MLNKSEFLKNRIHESIELKYVPEGGSTASGLSNDVSSVLCKERP